MTNPDITRLADGLINMEKERLIGWQGPLGAAYNVISEDLCSEGLLNRDWSLSPIGLAVRAYLMEKNMTEPTVTQADRDAAALYSKHHGRHAQAANVRRGSADSTFHLKLLAAHREATESATIEKVVKWLRSEDGPTPGYTMDLHDANELADAIERGEWKEMGHD